MKLTLSHIIALLALALMATSCSTTKVLAPTESRLMKNKIEVDGDKHFNVKELEPYIKQRPQPRNPLIAFYNLRGKNENSLWSKITSKVGIAPQVFESDLVNGSVDNIRGHLEALGYYGSKVSAHTTTRKQKSKVLYSIKLGKQYPIKDLTFSLPSRGTFAEDFLRDTASIGIKKGSFLSEEALEAETIRSASRLREQGYFELSKNNYSFVADTLTCRDSAIVEMKVGETARNEVAADAHPLRKFNFGKVTITQPKSLKFREKVLRDHNTVIPGTLYNESTVSLAYERLSSIRVFNSVNVELTPSDTNKVDCNISLAPGKLQGFKLNMEASSNSSGLFGISPELSYYHKNIFRGGELLNLSFMGNFQFKFNDDVKSTEFGVSAGITLPKLLFIPSRLFKGSIPKTNIKASYNYQDRPEYTRHMVSTSVGVVGSHKQFYYQIYPAQLNIVRLVNIDSTFYKSLEGNPFMRNAYQNHFDLGLGASLYFTDNTSVNPKTDRYFVNIQFNLAGNLLSAFKSLMKKDVRGSGIIWNTPYSQYVRGEVSLGKTWRLGKTQRQSIATRLSLGAGHAYGNSSVLPFEQHFYAGGASSLRGWQARGVGPGLSKRDTSFVIPNQTGDMKIEMNLEYRFPLFWKFEGATFVDAGNIWTLDKNGSEDAHARFSGKTFIRGIAADFGLGLRLDLNFILVRVDLGVPFHDPSRDAGERWVSAHDFFSLRKYALHFGVGYPF